MGHKQVAFVISLPSLRRGTVGLPIRPERIKLKGVCISTVLKGVELQRLRIEERHRLGLTEISLVNALRWVPLSLALLWWKQLRGVVCPLTLVLRLLAGWLVRDCRLGLKV